MQHGSDLNEGLKLAEADLVCGYHILLARHGWATPVRDQQLLVMT